MRNRKALFVRGIAALALALVLLFILLPKAATAEPDSLTGVHLYSGGGDELKGYLSSPEPYVIILEKDIDSKTDTEDPYWCIVNGYKILEMNGHKITIHNDDVYESTMFKISAGATLIINADADEDPDDVRIRYNGYIPDHYDEKFRNLFEVYGTLINNGANLHAGRSKGFYSDWFSYHYRQTHGNGVIVKDGGTFVMNSGRLYGRGESIIDEIDRSSAIVAEAGSTVYINGGTIQGRGGANCFQIAEGAYVRVATGDFSTYEIVEDWAGYGLVCTVGDIGITLENLAGKSVVSYAKDTEEQKCLTLESNSQYCTLSASNARTVSSESGNYSLFTGDTAVLKVEGYEDYFLGTSMQTCYLSGHATRAHIRDFTWIIMENGEEIARTVTTSDQLDLKKNIEGFSPVAGNIYTVRCLATERIIDTQGVTTTSMIYYTNKLNVAFDLPEVQGVELTEANFPDAVFRNYLSQHFDTEGGSADGYLSPKEIRNITYVNLGHTECASLQGVEYLTYLTTLYAFQNPLTSFNGAGNPYLMYLDLSECKLTSISLLNNSNLRFLDLDNCECNLGTTWLNLDGCPNLQQLDLYRSGIPNVSLLGCEYLLDLVLHSEVINNNNDMLLYKDTEADTWIRFTYFNEEKFYVTRLNNTYFPDSHLRNEIQSRFSGLVYNSFLSVSQAKSITGIEFDGESVTSLKGIESFPNLTYLSVTNGSLTSADLSKNKKLEVLYLNGNKLESLNVSGLTALKALDVSYNKLRDLNLRGLSSITSLECSDNKLSRLDTTELSALTAINCNNNQLKELIVNENTKLSQLYCAGNLLQELYVYDCGNLVYLNCSDNKLTDLSVDNNTKLTYLNTVGNNIPAIDITGCSTLNTIVTKNTPTHSRHISTDSIVAEDSWKDPANPGVRSVTVNGSTMLITNPKLNYAIVTFESNGGSEVSPVAVLSGCTIDYPGTPTYGEMIFVGWYRDAALTDPFSFGPGGIIVTNDITLYAKWVSKDQPKITVQPVDKSIPVGESFTLSVTAKGTSALTYQWQYKTPNSTNWVNSGAGGSKTATISLTAKTTTNNYSYRCIVTDAKGNSTASDAATLKVLAVITAQPSDKSINEGESFSFTVEAEGVGLTYQWEYKSPSATTWSISGAGGAKTPTILLTAKLETNDYLYRCIIKDANGTVLTSREAKLTVIPSITEPVDKIALIGTSVKFTATMPGTGLRYQWQYQAPNSSTWVNSGAGGAKTSTISLTAKSSTNGYKYRCLITDKNGTVHTSRAATLKVKAKIVTQPASKSATVGTKVTFTVAAEGAGLKYQWQYRTANTTTWVNSGAAGAKTATVTLTAKAATNRQCYRCVITDANGTVLTSNAAKMTATAKITTQPVSKTATAGSKVTFTVGADGAGLKYQWQYRTANTTTWVNSGAAGAKTATVTLTAKTATNGQRYRCVVTDVNGTSIISNDVSLTAK